MTASLDIEGSTTESRTRDPAPDIASSIRSTNEMQQARILRARLQEVTQRPLLAYVIVDDPLAEGALARIHLGAPGTLRRYVVVSAVNFDDLAFRRIADSQLHYEMSHPDDPGPVTITLYRDGRLESISPITGHVVGTHLPDEEVIPGSDQNAVSRSMLHTAAQLPYANIPGVGRARVIGPDFFRRPAK